MVTDKELAGLQAQIGSCLPDYLADLERLVNIDCGSYTKSGVDEVGRWVAGQLRELGADVKAIPHDTLGETVVGVLEGSGRGRALLVGHMDTVFGEGTAKERPFVIDDGRAYGPGVDDMKGGLLTGLYALRALRATRGGGAVADWLPFERLTFVANPDEEIGSPSSTPHIENAARDATVAFVLESARENGDIVSERKGIAEFRITVNGRAAHAGVEPEKGRSAVLEAAHKIVALHELNGRWPGVTVNVGVVNAGTRPNIVAESCVMDVDVRAKTPAEMEAAEAAIRDICGVSTVADTSCVIERSIGWEPMHKTPAVAALAELAIALAARVGYELHDASTGGASDANTIAGMGVPTLDGLGPVGGADHAPGEYLEVATIVPRTTLFAALLLSVAEEP
ncbi:MAG: M20 family metallopeptidase [Chloroflexota bacterium]